MTGISVICIDYNWLWRRDE